MFLTNRISRSSPTASALPAAHRTNLPRPTFPPPPRWVAHELFHLAAMELFTNAKQSQVTLVAQVCPKRSFVLRVATSRTKYIKPLVFQDASHGLHPSPLKSFRRSPTATAMKTIKNLWGPRLSCHQCKKSFKPSDPEEVYCSTNCSRKESWLEMNKAHIAKQRALGLYPQLDADIPGTKRASLAPSRFSSSDKLVSARPTTAPPWHAEFSLRPSSNRDSLGSPRRVMRKRSRSTSCDSSPRTLCSVYPPLPPSPSRSSLQRMSRRISETPSQAGTLVADPFYHPDPHEDDAYSRLVLQNRSSASLAHPPRPRLTSSMTMPVPSPLSMAVPRPTSAPKKPFLARKPNYPIASATRPSIDTIPGPPTKSITLALALGTPAADGAPPTSPPTPMPMPAPPESDPPARLRAGFDRRATRPRSNSFGGFGSLAIHAI